MLIATADDAHKMWLGYCQSARHIEYISMVLYDLDEQMYVCPFKNTSKLECTKEAVKAYLEKEYPEPDYATHEEIMEYIDWEKGYIYDECTHMQYWNDEHAAFGWEFNINTDDEVIGTLVYELAVGGPNAHLIEKYKITPNKEYYPFSNKEFIKREFQYHWWSPLYTINLIKMPENPTDEDRLMFDEADNCFHQIEEQTKNMFQNQFETWAKENLS